MMRLKPLGVASVSRSLLVRMRTLALRRGLWFRVLTGTERACVDLTIRVVDEVRSGMLMNALLSVLRKLDEVVESRVVRSMRDVGVEAARRLSSVAVRWGNSSAASWAWDPRFVRFLAVLHLNAS
jgi:hypothetical protein